MPRIPSKFIAMEVTKANGSSFTCVQKLDIFSNSSERYEPLLLQEQKLHKPSSVCVIPFTVPSTPFSISAKAMINALCSGVNFLQQKNSWSQNTQEANEKKEEEHRRMWVTDASRLLENT